jgi:hypothetical protein
MLQYSGIDVAIFLDAKAPFQAGNGFHSKKIRDFAVTQSSRPLAKESSLVNSPSVSPYAKPAKTIGLNFKPAPVQSRKGTRSDVLSMRDETRQTSLFVSSEPVVLH